MKKVLGLIVICFLVVGCANTSWQTKSTTTMLGGAGAITPVEKAFHPPCNAGTFPADKCSQLKKIYNDTRGAWVAGKNTVVLAMRAVDAQQSGNLMEQWPLLWTKFGDLTNELILLVQQIQADKTGTKMPNLPGKKVSLTGVEISLIVTILTAIVQAIPSVWAAIQGGQVNQADIEVLIAQLNAAEASIPVWQ